VCTKNDRTTSSLMTNATTIRPLIVFEDGQYRVDPDTATWLSQRTTPFGVLACAGKFRTGKSFLMNRLLSRPPGKGFGVGETVQACTRGIWLCTEFLNVGGRDVLVLDTEGIDALDAENAHDVRVFALAVLMCSAFAYNSMSHLDEAAVQTLSLMTRITDAVGEDGAHAPSLYWILRDFSLQLVDGQGNPMSHSEYLEQALTQPSTSAKCATREAIRKVFPTRHLVTLPRPHRGESAQKLDAKTPSALQPKFDKFLAVFRNHVCEQVQPFRVAGVEVGGTVYVEHVRNLVDAVNRDGVVPNVEDSWSLLARTQHAEQFLSIQTRAYERVHVDCPHGSTETVTRWIADAVTEIVGSVTFLQPAPTDLWERTHNLCTSLFEEATRLGRVRTLRDRAVELTGTLVEAFRETDDPTRLVPPPTCHDLDLRNLTSFLVLSEHVGAVHASGRAIGMRDKQRELTLEMEQLRHDATEAESRARTTTVECAPTVERCDACTQTDLEEIEVPPSPMVEDVENARMLVDLRTLLSTADERASSAERDLEAARRREEVATKTFEEAMDTFRGETVERIDECARDTECAREEARGARAQREALATEMERLRALASEAQERTIEVHKNTLEELRRRDTESRSVTDTLRAEHAELRVREEMASNENRTLKRRMDELLVETEEAKRVRTTLLTEHAREEAERESLRTQTSSLRTELDAARATNVDLESQMAVLKATSKLESCRRSLSSSGRVV